MKYMLENADFLNFKKSGKYGNHSVRKSSLTYFYKRK